MCYIVFISRIQRPLRPASVFSMMMMMMMMMHAVHGRPIEYQWIRNGTGVMVRKPSYSFKPLVNVYNVRLNVYKIKR